MSQIRLAVVSGVSRATINAIERGRSPHPRIETLRSLAAALGMQPHTLLALALASPSHEDAQRLPSPSRKLQKLTTP